MVGSRLRVLSGLRSRSGSNDSSGKSSPKSSRNSNRMSILNHGAFKLLVIGSPGVGKTSICKRYIGCNFEVEYEPDDEVFDTSIFLNMTGEECTRQYDLEIFDVECKCDIKSYKKKVTSADGFILVYSKDNKESFMKLTETISDIRHFKDSTVPIIIMGNKSDIETSKIQVKNEDLLILPYTHFDISARENSLIQTAFHSIVTQCAERKDKHPLTVT